MSIILERPKDFSAIHLCPVCKTCYTTEEEARACAAKVYPLDLKPGDVTIMDEFYTWADDSEWIASTRKGDPKHPSHFYHKDTHRFYYVVLAIGTIAEVSSHGAMFFDNRHEHRPAVTIATGAIFNEISGIKSYRRGWTTRDTHIGWGKKVEDQVSVSRFRDQMASLIGQHSRNLL